ncbi:MAG: hypothetical protein CM1200mP29_06840 [Verrucomicrobiota bacterium]|nr:MAG: hypothetical protein CM1200mP29_06840 [Verrucomicrobiota bacterium]
MNGEPKADGTVSTTAFGTVNLGRRASSKNCPLNGALDDVSIFDRGLSSDEIGQLYNGEAVAEGLVLSWEFVRKMGLLVLILQEMAMMVRWLVTPPVR